MEIKGYKNVEYPEFVILLGACAGGYYNGGGNELKLADIINVKSIQTVRNCFNPDRQMVADDTITSLFKAIEFDSIILWKDGVRYYYVKK